MYNKFMAQFAALSSKVFEEGDINVHTACRCKVVFRIRSGSIIAFFWDFN